MRGPAAALTALLLTTGAQAAPAMWEASDADSRIVLFGSIHALPPGVDWRTPLLDQAMADADLVYFETDIGPLGMASLTFKILTQMFQTVSQPWLDRLNSEQFETLLVALEPLDISLEEAAVTPPWILAMELTDFSLRSDEMGGSMDMSLGVESVLQWELPKEGKGYLETPGEQFDLLTGGTVDQQIQQLFMVIEEGGLDGGDSLATLVNSWIAGDVENLEMKARTPAEAEALDILLGDRNRKWMPTIRSMLDNDAENLVVVGAAHLVGEDNVLDLLVQAGYTVNRIQ